MPRHLISDAHEWINEIPTVPIYYLAKPQPRERAWQNQRGKKTLKLNGVDSIGNVRLEISCTGNCPADESCVFLMGYSTHGGISLLDKNQQLWDMLILRQNASE